MPRKSVEDYLKAIFDLSRNGNEVSTTEISRALKVAPSSVTEMLKKLVDKGLIEHSPYHGTTLTRDGKRIAEKIVRKHRLLERFLCDVLKIDKSKVHKQACEMEHSLSDEAEESLCRFLRHPDRRMVYSPWLLPLSWVNASRYFRRVFETTSSGKAGPGAFLFQSSVSR